MPVSDTSTHQAMCDFINEMANKKSDNSILDCGVGAGLIAKSIAEQCQIKKIIYGLEVFAPYIENPGKYPDLKLNYHNLYESIITGEPANYAVFLPEHVYGDFDFIIFGDSLEHVLPNWAEHSLFHACRIARKAVIVNCPVHDMPQGAVNGNEWERHYAFYTQEKMENWGAATLFINKDVGCFAFTKANMKKAKIKFLPIEKQPKGPF